MYVTIQTIRARGARLPVEYPTLGERELLMKPWPGHLPTTCTALLSIMKRASMDECEFSHDERVLFTAGEFWAAVSASELLAHLDSQPEKRLRMAGIALHSLGAVSLAQAIFAGIDDLRNVNTRARRNEYVARLEHQLRVTDDSVDSLIGLLAQRCMSVVTTDQPASLRVCGGTTFACSAESTVASGSPWI